MFQYITFRSACAIILSLIIATVVGKRVIRMLQRQQIGEEIRDLGLQGREFGTDDVRDLLLGEYDVDAETAERDAQAWVARLKTCNLVEE